jgi:hypothetical protein
MKNKFAAVALLFAGVQLGGCATVLNGTSQDVAFNTDPQGAVINIITGQNCTTPCEFSMKRGDDSRVDITMPGYKPVSVYIQSRLAGSTFGNILLGGGIGAVVDGSNGSSNRLFPNPVYVRLAREGSTDEAVLLSENGEVISTVAAHNAEVEADVLEGIEGQGLTPRTAATGN